MKLRIELLDTLNKPVQESLTKNQKRKLREKRNRNNKKLRMELFDTLTEPVQETLTKNQKRKLKEKRKKQEKKGMKSSPVSS